MAKNLFQEIEKIGIKCFFVPGNHDHYTKQAQKEKLFYQYFENQSSSNLSGFSLKKDGVEAHLLKDGIWYIGLDTALATGYFSSNGTFSYKIETDLTQLLCQIPSSSKIILVNHFPFLDITSQRKTLKRKKALTALLKKHPNIILYLHGHTHKHAIEDLRKENLPIILDSGSAALNTVGRLNIITLNQTSCEIEVFRFQDKWKKVKDQTFILNV